MDIEKWIFAFIVYYLGIRVSRLLRQYKSLILHPLKAFILYVGSIRCDQGTI